MEQPIRNRLVGSSNLPVGSNPFKPLQIYPSSLGALLGPKGGEFLFSKGAFKGVP